MLTSKNADVDKMNSYGYTALHFGENKILIYNHKIKLSFSLASFIESGNESRSFTFINKL